MGCTLKDSFNGRAKLTGKQCYKYLNFNDFMIQFTLDIKSVDKLEFDAEEYQ